MIQNLISDFQLQYPLPHDLQSRDLGTSEQNSGRQVLDIGSGFTSEAHNVDFRITLRKPCKPCKLFISQVCKVLKLVKSNAASFAPWERVY